MEIKKHIDNEILYVALKGRLDTVTSQDLLNGLPEIDQVKSVEFDFQDLEYISSAGLRVLVSYQKKLGGKDHVIVKNANPVVKNIFTVTGLGAVLTLA